MRSFITMSALAFAKPSLCILQSSDALFDLCSLPGLDKLSFNPVCAGTRSAPNLEPQIGGIMPCLLDGTCGIVTTKKAEPVSAPPHEINKSSLWSHKPRCIRQENSTESYCVYSSSTFANNRGISIFTSPEEMQKLSELAAFKESTVQGEVNQVLNPPYVAKELPGRGVGLIANRTLQRGDRIFSHTPVFMVHENVFTTFVSEDRFAFQHTAIQRLPKKSQKAFMDLCGHFGGDHIDDVINTNSFGVELWEGMEETAYNLVFPEISRLNHDCRPNAHYYFDPNTMTQHVHALRAIYPGEELTISYIDPAQTREDRQKALHASWGFHCSCSLCTQPSPITSASDARIEHIEELRKDLEDYSPGSDASPAMADLLVSLYEQERMHGPIAEAYTLAAIEYNGVGDVYKALLYARLAIEAGLLYGGPDDKDVKAMEALVADPWKHWSWMLRSTKRMEANIKAREEGEGDDGEEEEEEDE